MSDATPPSEKTDWRRIGLIATVLFVPGGFVLGGILAARRMRAAAAVQADTDDATAQADAGSLEGTQRTIKKARCVSTPG